MVDDGNGESLVAVNVKRWRPDDPSMRKLFEGVDTLPDGTRIGIRRGPASGGGEGAVKKHFGSASFKLGTGTIENQLASAQAKIDTPIAFNPYG
ncbi:hypothetical protein [Streptomyces sp. NPDC059979]|uniref:hypothetical protein n=1 Tax=Streptomyces sp. NPDC059979 TaxID=3347021 RepID=UPI00369A2603